MLGTTLHKARLKLQTFTLRGDAYWCPLCERGYTHLLEAGVMRRPNALCPGCESLERHRLLWVGLQRLRADGRITWGGRMLHVAPEPCLAQRFRESFDYLSIDMDSRYAMRAMDLTRLDLPTDEFDCAICNHVLEHIPDDRKAMSELRRVLKPGGWASLQVPIKGTVTDEDLTVTDPQVREQRYGQSDHVRQYGTDFSDRLRAAGFQVSVYGWRDFMTAAEANRQASATDDEIIIAVNNASA